jgi:hypothetical protein
MYKYKLKENKEEIKDKMPGESANEFQQKRIRAFKNIESDINKISKAISNAKNETIEFYKSNPGSYDIIYGTDLIQDYLKDIKTLLKI